MRFRPLAATLPVLALAAVQSGAAPQAALDSAAADTARALSAQAPPPPGTPPGDAHLRQTIERLDPRLTRRARSWERSVNRFLRRPRGSTRGLRRATSLFARELGDARKQIAAEQPTTPTVVQGRDLLLRAIGRLEKAVRAIRKGLLAAKARRRAAALRSFRNAIALADQAGREATEAEKLIGVNL